MSTSAVEHHAEMRSGVIVASSKAPMIPQTRKRELQVIDDYSTSLSTLLSQYVSADEEEKLAPETRVLDLTDKIEKLNTELRLAMAEAAEEGEEKPVYLRISNFCDGRFGYDWYMYDLVKKRRMKVFDRLEWEGGVEHHYPAVVVSRSVIYVLGGSYCVEDVHGGEVILYSKHVHYFDTQNPQYGWKVGPQLPSTHVYPFATSVDEKLYVFGVRDTVPDVLDTAAKEAGWKCLPKLVCQPLLSSTAHHDPSRDRILLRTYVDGLFAYCLLENKWEHIDPKFVSECYEASIVVGDVLYYHPCASFNHILCAYDLVHCRQLTPVYHNLSDYGNSGKFMDWDHLLDLGCGKLCLVKFSQISKVKEAFFLKLKVAKETGDENKVHITMMSTQRITMEGPDHFEGALTL